MTSLGAAVWIGSWYLMYLEVTRWHHVKPSLACNWDLDPRAGPGQPLIFTWSEWAAGERADSVPRARSPS